MRADVTERIRRTFDSHADDNAIEQDGAWLTWRDVQAFGRQIDALLAEAGCATGRVGIIIRNRPAHAAAVIGLLAVRRSVSFIYPFGSKEVLAGQIAALGAVAILADVADWPDLHEAVARSGGAGIALPARLVDGPSLVQGLERGPDDVTADSASSGEIEVLSSGTTGTPKRTPMPMHLLERAVDSAPGGESGSVPPVQINVWPLGGVGGVCILVSAAATATPLVLIDRFTVPALVDAVKRHRPPTLGLPPAAIRMILDENVPPEDLASVKVVSGGSAALDPDLQDRFEQKYDCILLWAMGATEFCGTIIRWTPDMRAAVGDSKRGSVGQAMPGVALRVVDPDTGTDCPPDIEGLLEVHCPAVREGWLRTTDLVAIDPDGFVYHRGRHDGAISRGGFKILPERVVEALCTHPAVADAAVVGLPDERLGAVPAAVVELKPGEGPLSEGELAAHLRARLAPTHIPATIRIVDALPRTPSMKVSLADVRALLSDRRRDETAPDRAEAPADAR